MKRILIVILILSMTGMLFAQTEIGAIDPFRLGVDTAQQNLKEVSVERFEREGFWRSTMSGDTGYINSRLFMGGPMGKQPIPDELGMNIPDSQVLGARIDFLRRGHTSFTLSPIRPIPIEGITKTVSVWVAGRNFNHRLVLLIEDFFGRPFELYMGTLNFQGWRQLTVAVPPQPRDGMSGIVQRNFHYNNQMGIKITGLRVDVDPFQAHGNYYIYFDDLRAVTDLFAENDRDPDDMLDFW